MCVLFWGAHKSLAPRARTLLGGLGQATLSFFVVTTLLFFFVCECPKFCDLAKQRRKMFGGVSAVGKDDFSLYFIWLCIFFLVLFSSAAIARPLSHKQDKHARCVVLCVGCPRHLAPVHRCVRSVCCFVCAVSSAIWLLFTGVPGHGVPSLCCPWCLCVCSFLAQVAPVHRCARCVRCRCAGGGFVSPPPPLIFFCAFLFFFLKNNQKMSEN